MRGVYRILHGRRSRGPAGVIRKQLRGAGPREIYAGEPWRRAGGRTWFKCRSPRHLVAGSSRSGRFPQPVDRAGQAGKRRSRKSNRSIPVRAKETAAGALPHVGLEGVSLKGRPVHSRAPVLPLRSGAGRARHLRGRARAPPPPAEARQPASPRRRPLPPTAGEYELLLQLSWSPRPRNPRRARCSPSPRCVDRRRRCHTP